MMQFEALIANDYRALLDPAKRLSPSAQKFYAPHFIVETSEWQKASKRIMFVGQETRGWGWYANEQPLDVTLGEASHRSDALTLLFETIVDSASRAISRASRIRLCGSSSIFSILVLNKHFFGTIL